MPTAHINPGQFVALEYTVPRSSVIEFNVDAEMAVDVHIVDFSGFYDFSRGREFTTYGGEMNRLHQAQQIRLPFRGAWYLIIKNRAEEQNRVDYDVRY